MNNEVHLIKTVCFALFFIFSLPSFAADQISLVFINSPKGINWKTPFSLTVSTINNSLLKFKNKRVFAISHVFVNLKCDSLGKDVYVGMTSATTTEERELLLKHKVGLGLMFHTYVGKLEKTAEIVKDLESYHGSDRVAKMTTLVSNEACARMLDYAQDYEARGFGAMYSGLQADPLKGEGSGCSAFGMSFLEVAGLLEPEYFTKWREHLYIPKRFIGGPLTGRKVPVTRLLFRPGAKWSDREPHIELHAWNPEKMHSWVGRVHHQSKKGQSIRNLVEIRQVGKTKEVIFDKTHYPTPSGPYWKFKHAHLANTQY